MRKALLALCAWLPIAMVIGLAIYLVVGLGLAGEALLELRDHDLKRLQELLLVLVGGATVIAFVQIGCAIALIIDASGRGITGGPLAGWVIGFLFVGSVVMPIYWVLYVARDRRVDGPRPPGPPTPQGPGYGPSSPYDHPSPYV